ncbi:peptide-methionine (S)-S-oxide reductase [Pigmentiphaga sp. NML080357]|uniref:peptide-methionine (S)-S-oxide reductase MsrA n=1 Tax=Pigmentiphaga sp. NML080357 TaxID=2008675 RepID=UPI000B4130AB|nr:peptide-methionine (S)-S-oxide reductase MsrA [Pigmentiphaga sp. NML080357]OVZ61212.1 peptide-methionine (S)-S-oxide reductase [Pigmentiphaga sp. NML080357]
MPAQVETAVFGGGCFWCIEAVFQQIEGVLRADSGYAGGHVERPTYEQVCEGNTGHVEVVSITYDPAVIDYHELLEIFFASHDPTTPNRQGNDVGPQYRSAIFWQTPAQQEAAREVIADLQARNVFGAPIVTELLPPSTVWPAEDYHRDYFLRNPGQGYCAFVVAPKVAKMRKNFAHKLKKT